MTLTEVGETNFWEGAATGRGPGMSGFPTMAGSGTCVGRMCSAATPPGSMAHDITWETGDGRLLLQEQRRLGFAVNAAESLWTLDYEMDIRNATEAPLNLGAY